MKSMGTGWVHGLSGLGERLHLDIRWLTCWPTEMKFYLFFHRQLFLQTKLWEEHTSQVYVSDSLIAHVLRNVHWTWFHLLFLWFQNPVQRKEIHDQKCFLWSVTQLIRKKTLWSTRECANCNGCTFTGTSTWSQSLLAGSFISNQVKDVSLHFTTLTCLL